MIVIAGTFRVNPEQAAHAATLIRTVVEATRSEEGCIRYEMHALHDSGYFVFEEWTSEEALEIHLASAHTRHYLDALVPCLVEAPRILKYTVTSSGPLF